MKNKITYILQTFILGLILLGLVNCDRAVEVFSTDELQINTAYPDLRFANIADEYNYPASGVATDSIKVKSLYHNWTIKGTADNPWYKISPSSGEPGVLYNVGISANDNTSLDDRVDTLALISDGWIGKRIIIHQKGTAYLRTIAENTTLSEDVGDKLTIDIESNQNWKVEIAKKVDWIAFEGSSSGSSNGSVTLITTKENGSLRKSGKIYVYDRNDLLADSLTIYQNGIYVDIENRPGEIPLKGGSASVDIKSNTSWTITIPEDANDWLSVDKSSGEGGQVLNFTIDRNPGISRKAYVKVESSPSLVTDTILITQVGAIPFTEEFFVGDNITYNSDGSATLRAAPGTDSQSMKSTLTNFSYGKYTVKFADIQIARTSSTMLMSITAPNKFNGGISWGAYAGPAYSDGWASEYWISDAFGSKVRQRFDNDILRGDIKEYTIDVKKSLTPGMVDIDFYINDQLLKSETGTDGFAQGNPMIVSFWIYNYYDKENAAIFKPSTLTYEPY